jgi:DNA replication and repair protein RecF
MLRELQLKNFRCFESLTAEFSGGFNFIIGANGQGKTSILEAACVLLRLQSQRSSTLAPLLKFGAKSFAVAGDYDGHRLDFRYTALRRKIAFDGVDQRETGEYLRVGRVVSFSNTDIDLARGSSEPRRRYLDFIGSQIGPVYRPTLRAYERALRCRNALLKSAQPRPREIAAYDQPLLEHGAALSALRAGRPAIPLILQRTSLTLTRPKRACGKPWLDHIATISTCSSTEKQPLSMHPKVSSGRWHSP